MKLIIFDIEVFKYDILLGLYVVDNEDRSKKELYQTWDKEEIKKIYQVFKDDIWIGHNNKFYDNNILEAVLFDKDPYNTSIGIIYHKKNKGWVSMPLNYFDLNEQVMVKLKITEAYWGKNIHMSEIDFDIDRPLTNEEKLSTELYNKSDLDQTYENFLALQHTFDLKLSLIEEFKLDFKALTQSISNIAAVCLGVNDVIPSVPIEPYIFPQLQLENKELLNYYKTQKFRTEKFKFDMNGVEHIIGIGGIHGARKKFYGESTNEKTIWYLDVAGYYNLLMINYDLFSRSMNQEAKDFYKKLYYDQLELRYSNPVRRRVFKLVLLSVFGATRNKYTKFYDPYHFEMITLNGQLFLVDLLEKLTPYMKLIQSNTDGIIIEVDKTNEQYIQPIIEEWENRTRFTLKKEKVKKIVQRDVNNYLVEKEGGEVDVLGEALKYYKTYNNPFQTDFGAFITKEPLIISIMLTEVLLNGIFPEESIKKYQTQLRLFQFICKKDTFSKIVLTTNGIDQDIQEISRAFPSLELTNSTIYKVKPGKRMKISNLPPSVFVYNDEILSEETIVKLSQRIDWQWYINRVYERLDQFIE